MAPEPARTRNSVRRRILPFEVSRRALVVFGAIFLAACSSSDCGCEGFEQRPFPPEHYDKTTPQGAQIRLSPTGIEFIEQNVEGLISGAIPGGLNFCLPRDDGPNADPKLCFPYVRGRSGHHMRDEQPTCDDGTEGCQISLTIESTEIRPVPDRRLEVDIVIGDLNPTVPFETEAPVIGTAKCDVTAYKRGSDVNTPATVRAIVPVDFDIDQMSPTRDLQLNVQEIQLNLDDVDFDLAGGWKCGAADLLRGLFRGTIEDLIRDQLGGTVDDLLRENLCLSCAEDPMACPQSASCAEDGVCVYDNSEDECVPAPLGVEGRLKLVDLLGQELTQQDEANVDTMFKMADFVRVDEGVTLAGRTGFQPERLAECAPVDPTARPGFAPVPISSALTSDQRPNGTPYMIAIGVHERIIEQVLWAAWASGGTCLQADSSLSDALSTASLGILLRGIRRLADGETRPVEIKIVPQRAPVVELGANTVTETMDGYAVDEGLLTIDWRDLDVHMYGWVQDRYTRLFTVRIDLLLPVALVPDGMGSLAVALGDFEAAIQNVRPRNSKILSDDPEKIKDLIPTLVGLALPSLASSLDLAFELPEFFGLRIALGQGDVTSLQDGQDEFVAIFADLEQAPMMMAMSAQWLPQPEIVDWSVSYPEPIVGDLVRPELTVDVRGLLPGPIPQPLEPGEEVEFAWRVDGGPWSLYRKRGQLHIDAPQMALPGEHTLEVRARMAGDPYTANREVTAMRTILIDYQPPQLTIEREGRTVELLARDLTDGAEQLWYRWRVHDGQRARPWTEWTHKHQLELAQLGVAGGPARLEVEVRDRSGKIARDEQTIRAEAFEGLAPMNQPAAPAAPSADGAADDQAAACAAAPGQRPAAPGGLLLLLGAVGLWGVRRRRWAAAALSSLLGLAAAGCTDDVAQQQGGCAQACGDGEVCRSGQCVEGEGSNNPDNNPNQNNPEGADCVGDDECPEGQWCEEGMCVEPECTEDTDCAEGCAPERRGVCTDAQTCACEDFCPQGCADGEFCCNADNACQALPDPCDGQVCEPGFEPGEPVPGAGDPLTCMVSGGSCACVPLPPLPLGTHGRWADVTQDDQGTTYVSAYNQTYGDLMVGTLEGETFSWEFIDGVPAEGDIEGGLDGPRGGVADRGADVGQHTAIAVDDQGQLHVFYRDVDAGALKYARGQLGSGFEITALDELGDVGHWTQASFTGGQVHLAYHVPSFEEQGQPPASHVRYRAIDPAADLAAVAGTPGELVLQGPGAEPCAEECAEGDVCLQSAGQCATPTDDCGMCAEGFACAQGTCEAVFTQGAPQGLIPTVGQFLDLTPTPDGGLLLVFYDGDRGEIGWLERSSQGAWGMPQYVGAPSGPYASAMKDAAGTIHLAYMDESEYALLYQAIGGMGAGPEVITRGLRETGDEYLINRIGEGVELRVRGDGQPEVTYQDATRHILYKATRQMGGGWQAQAIGQAGDPYDGAHGFYSAMLRTPGASVVIDYVINSQAEQPTATPSAHALP